MRTKEVCLLVASIVLAGSEASASRIIKLAKELDSYLQEPTL